MECNLILILACIAIEVSVAGIAAYFLLKKRKTTAVVTAPSSVASAAAAVAPVRAKAPASRFAKCIKCGRTVARYTQTPEGPICANELPIV